MTQPLALVLYEKLLPGTQLVNRLQDLNYRVQALTDVNGLVDCARQEKPMVIFLDLVFGHQNVVQLISRLQQEPETRHIPLVAFGTDDESENMAAAQKAGAKLVVSQTAVLSHLPQLLEQALRVD